MTKNQIIVNNLSYSIADTPVKFNAINLSFSSKCYGVVGRNGIGKSTLLKLLSGELQPMAGSIKCSGSIGLLPQLCGHISADKTVAEVLGADKYFAALSRVQEGSAPASDFDLLASHWDIEATINAVLEYYHLRSVSLDAKFHLLSGGQKTKIFLAKADIFPTDFLLLDEPTNNLDCQSREQVYSFVKRTNKGIVLVSHDRELLNHCDVILEVGRHGIEMHTGNYDHFFEQKQNRENALQHAIHIHEQQKSKAAKLIQNRHEKHQKSQSKGRREKAVQIKAKNTYNKIEMNTKKERSDKTHTRLKTQASRITDLHEKNVKDAKVSLYSEKEISAILNPFTPIPGAVVLAIDKLAFTYNNAIKPIFDDLTLTVFAGERVAISGENGGGKSTLIKLIMKQLNPTSGNIDVCTNKIAFIDQEIAFLRPEDSVLDNYLHLNPGTSVFDAHSRLAAFNFRNTDAHKCVEYLSGGERVRAGLAVALLSTQTPELLILDEPSNHLDIESIHAIEEMLALYQGTLIVVSHDTHFIKNLNVTKLITL